MLYRITLSEDVAADLLQELFLKLADTKLNRSIDNRSAYARRIAINLALEWRRRRKPAHSIDDFQSSLVTDAFDDPFESASQKDEVNRVLDALAQIPSEIAKQCFTLRFIEQVSYESIALQMNKPPHQVRALCHSIVRKIRQSLGAEVKQVKRKRVES